MDFLLIPAKSRVRKKIFQILSGGGVVPASKRDKFVPSTDDGIGRLVLLVDKTKTISIVNRHKTLLITLQFSYNLNNFFKLKY